MEQVQEGLDKQTILGIVNYDAFETKIKYRITTLSTNPWSQVYFEIQSFIKF